MATYNGARIDKIDELINRFTYDADQLPNAVANGMMMAASLGNAAMRQRILTAATKTGVARAARGGPGPGRERSGAMLKSTVTADSQPADVSVRGNKVRLNFGYIDESQTLNTEEGSEHKYGYIAIQEYEFYSISGQLLAMQLGFNQFTVHVYDLIAQEYKAMDEDAKAKRFHSRANLAAVRVQDVRDIHALSAQLAGA